LCKVLPNKVQSNLIRPCSWAKNRERRQKKFTFRKCSCIFPTEENLLKILILALIFEKMVDLVSVRTADRIACIHAYGCLSDQRPWVVCLWQRQLDRVQASSLTDAASEPRLLPLGLHSAASYVKKPWGQNVAVLRQTAENFRQTMRWVLKILLSPEFLWKWGFPPRFLYFWQELRFQEETSFSDKTPKILGDIAHSLWSLPRGNWARKCDAKR